LRRRHPVFEEAEGASGGRKMGQGEQIADERNARADLERPRYVNFSELIEQDDGERQWEKDQTIRIRV
jgi:hypothetical protein